MLCRRHFKCCIRNVSINIDELQRWRLTEEKLSAAPSSDCLDAFRQTSEKKKKSLNENQTNSVSISWDRTGLIGVKKFSIMAVSCCGHSSCCLETKNKEICSTVFLKGASAQNTEDMFYSLYFLWWTENWRLSTDKLLFSVVWFAFVLVPTLNLTNNLW